MHVGTLPATGLPEISGIVASRAQPGVFWVENDSGNPADVFAIDATGLRLATVHIASASNVDWEDISIDRRAGVEELYIIDAGDNLARTSDGAMGRASIQIYRLSEPNASAGDATLTAERFVHLYGSYLIPLESSHRFQLMLEAASAKLGYLPGFEQNETWQTGAGAGISFTPDSKICRVILRYGYGFNAIRKGSEGAHSVGLLFQYDFEAKRNRNHVN